MTISVTGTVIGMRSNKLVTMDIEQLRGWATFMDRAVVVSLVVTVIAVAALASTSWLSVRIGNAVRAREHAAFLGHRAEMAKHAIELEQQALRARERALELEQQVTGARQRTRELEQAVSGARDRTRELEQAVSSADARAVQAARESATASERARSAEIDAEEVRKRVAELGKAVREARARELEPAPAPAEAPTESAAANREAPPAPPSPIVASLKQHAGTKAALYVLDEARDAPAVGGAISGTLSDAGWAPMTWTWTGVGGILGVVVLIKDGSDPPTNDAAAALVDALRTAGFNATKGDWPADWRRYRGTLNGPQTPVPTEAPIRIVIGNKAR
jgi:hypothetical protein